MKPCSVYCEPERGIHRFLDWCRTPDANGPTRIGDIVTLSSRSGAEDHCIEGDAVFVAFEPAAEVATEPESRWPYPFLVTMQVLP
jgi:hypothetical protein